MNHLPLLPGVPNEKCDERDLRLVVFLYLSDASSRSGGTP